jgi:hypothetical protein
MTSREQQTGCTQQQRTVRRQHDCGDELLQCEQQRSQHGRLPVQKALLSGPMRPTVATMTRPRALPRRRFSRSMPLIDLSAIGWKEAALVALVILAAYMGYALFRLSMVSAAVRTTPAPVADPEPTASGRAPTAEEIDIDARRAAGPPPRAAHAADGNPDGPDRRPRRRTSGAASKRSINCRPWRRSTAKRCRWRRAD